MFTLSLSHVCLTQRRIRRVNGEISSSFGGKLVLEGISKTDQNQSCRRAFLFCPQVSAKKCVVLA